MTGNWSPKIIRLLTASASFSNPTKICRNTFLLRSNPMRNFWLLILAIVIPIQTSWAAIHVCESAGVTLTAAAQHQEAAHAPSAAKVVDADQNSEVANPLADTCCSAAHGCHGLHSLMAQADRPMSVVLPSVSYKSSDTLLEPGHAHARLERPNWSAA
jgi:hypothetical protein